MFMYYSKCETPKFHKRIACVCFVVNILVGKARIHITTYISVHHQYEHSGEYSLKHKKTHTIITPLPTKSHSTILNQFQTNPFGNMPRIYIIYYIYRALLHSRILRLNQIPQNIHDMLYRTYITNLPNETNITLLAIFRPNANSMISSIHSEEPTIETCVKYGIRINRIGKSRYSHIKSRYSARFFPHLWIGKHVHQNQTADNPDITPNTCILKNLYYPISTDLHNITTNETLIASKSSYIIKANRSVRRIKIYT